MPLEIAIVADDLTGATGTATVRSVWMSAAAVLNPDHME
jgi:hypothetical protein